MSAPILDFRSQDPQAGAEPSKEELALDRRLDAALGNLPRERAGGDFTSGVLRRVDESRRSRSRWRSLAAAAVFTTMAGLAVGEWNERVEQQAAAERIAALRAEYGLLQEELESLQRAAQAKRQVVYLGGNGDIDYVLDLSRLTAGQNNVATSGSSL